MIAGEPIRQLAESLERARADESTHEIVQWLRAASAFACTIPAPSATDSSHGYTRTLLYRVPAFEILVLHWQPGCESAIHDHGGSRCWLTVAEGRMSVENYLRRDGGEQPGYASIAADGREELLVGSIDYRGDDIHLHRCVARDSPVISLHVYAHPIERFHAFDEGNSTCTEITSCYDAILDA